MDDEMLLKQPTDRRLAGDDNDLPPGPPGAENDDDYGGVKREKSSTKDSLKSRRRSPSGSPPPSKRKSPSRGPRSPRGRRTPSPRRRYGRNRDFSPDRRRFNDRGRGRRSPMRNRSRDRMDMRRNGRDRFRGGRRDSRSRSRSNSPPSRRRWSPKKKPSSPPIPPPGAQYGVPAPGMYADAYTTYGQYVPPQQAYVPADFVSAPPPAPFGAGYPPPPAWGVPPEGYPQPNWVPPPDTLQQAVIQPPPGAVVTQVPAAVQPPGTQPPPPTIGLDKKNDANPTHDAVAQEAENQRDELKKQRTSYLKKTSTLKKELKVLKDHRKALIGVEGSQSPTTKGVLDENERLQNQIQKKLSTIENVIDMLTGIIGEENLAKDAAAESPRKHSKKKRNASSSSSSDDSSSSNSSSSSSSSSSSDSEDNSSPERLKTKAIESMKHKRDVQGKGVLKEKKIKEDVKKSEEKKVNFVFYDPEMHWCKTCDTFPKTAKDYLTHLHTKDHTEQQETMETPWHTQMTHDEYPSFEGAPTKRTPIRGLTFFSPATAWYCKLCSVWMGDLHCASLHLKSKSHSNKYNAFLEKNPHFEVDWLSERQRVLNEKKTAPPPPQITSVSTTGGSDHKEGKSKSKHEDKEKGSKKRKKKSSDKKDKKKKKRSKKRKKTVAASPSSSSSNDSASDTEVKAAKKKLLETIPIIAESAATAAAAPSIRVQMRNLKKEKDEAPEPAAPPPPKISETPTQQIDAASLTEANKKDDLISQWNQVQPVISDSEKKLLEQLKGRLKNKPQPREEEKKREEKIVVPIPVPVHTKVSEKKSVAEVRDRERSPAKRDDDRSDRDKQKDNDHGGNVHRRRSRSRPNRRSKSRSPSRGRRVRRSRSRGGGMRRSRSRGGRRSLSRGRYSPRGYGRRRRSRSQRRRSRSHGRNRRRASSSRSRSRSRSSSHRIEKPIIRQPEFRPRVPEGSNIKKSKTKTNDEKEERKKSSKSSSSSAAQSSKKLPFIGRMPVFKKQSQSYENSDKKDGEDGDQTVDINPMMDPLTMGPDAYGHAGYEPSMMCEYDDLMPDPVQFVGLMGAPPPPPSQPPPQQYDEEEKDILPPGIDETESEFVPKPISDAPIPRKGPLPKDFEEALNIIFPGEKKPDDDSSKAKSSGETQIITDEPIMQQSDLIKEGIHMMTVEETSLVGMDEASQMSMNEPLQFNKPSSSVATPPTNNSGENSIDKSPPSMDPVEEAVAACVSAIPPPPPPPAEKEENLEIEEAPAAIKEIEIPFEETEVQPKSLSPTKELDVNDIDINLDAIDQPPSPTESEKIRRQEELDDLAMLGIDADDMAAQCI